MLQGAHVYSHQHQYGGAEPAWIHQQSHQHAQHAAVAAASQAAAQQRHYNQIAANHNAVTQSINMVHGQDSSMMENVVSDENKRTLSFIADLLNEDTREAALLELSKKREQVPELALILWHSFGMLRYHIYGRSLLTDTRCYDFTTRGDHISLHITQPFTAHCCCFEPSLQRPGTSTMRSFP